MSEPMASINYISQTVGLWKNFLKQTVFFLFLAIKITSPRLQSDVGNFNEGESYFVLTKLCDSLIPI